MPRVVDPEARRRDIANVTLRLLARDGAAGLSLRNIAAEMGGSLTMVTHYYPNRQALMTDLARQISATWQAALDEIDETHTEPRDRLRTFLAWLLPLTPHGHEEERARIALLAADHDPDCLVPKRRVPAVADLLRAFVSGVVLDAQLSPEAWPAKRQLALLDDLLAALLPD